MYDYIFYGEVSFYCEYVSCVPFFFVSVLVSSSVVVSLCLAPVGAWSPVFWILSPVGSCLLRWWWRLVVCLLCFLAFVPAIPFSRQLGR